MGDFGRAASYGSTVHRVHHPNGWKITVRVAASHDTGFMLLDELVEFDRTGSTFTNPKESRTEDYVTGKFG